MIRVEENPPRHPASEMPFLALFVHERTRAVSSNMEVIDLKAMGHKGLTEDVLNVPSNFHYLESFLVLPCFACVTFKIISRILFHKWGFRKRFIYSYRRLHK